MTAVFAFLTLGLILSAVYFHGRRTTAYRNYLWLAAVAGIYVWCVLKLSVVPIEALHFVQYGLLGILAYRALSHGVRDVTIYFAAAMICGMVGVVDEFIQWIVPGRFWTWHDIWINFLSGLLVQAAIALGIEPPIISSLPGPASIQRLSRVAMAGLMLLGATMLNTPENIAWYADRIPFLSFLKKNDTVMIEYGFLYQDTETGFFQSRFAPEKLRQIDLARGEEAAQILDRHRDRVGYRLFLKQYTPITDPFVHEARVHLFRRDMHFDMAKGQSKDPKKFAWHCTVAYCENQIMEKYFPTTLSHSNYGWSADKIASLKKARIIGHVYESRVSRNLFTRFSARQVFVSLVCVLAGLVFLDFYVGRRRHDKTSP